MRLSSDDSVFLAIACPTRRALLGALARGEKNVSQLVASLVRSTSPVGQSAVSQQLGVLERVGLVEKRSHAQFRYYRMRATPLKEVDDWLGLYRAHIHRELDALGDVLDAMPDTSSADAGGAPDAPHENAKPLHPRRKRKP
jgi:DNA-binding transcriptional ArsR family regulator